MYNMCVYMYVLYTCIYIYICMCVHSHMCICVYTFTYMHTNKFSYRFFVFLSRETGVGCKWWCICFLASTKFSLFLFEDVCRWTYS